MRAVGEEDPRITVARLSLHEFFRCKAAQTGVSIEPTLRDPKTTALVGRLFEEARGARAFYVCPTQSSLARDGFMKKTGLDYELELLNLFAKPEHLPLEELWRAYARWLHGGESHASILSDYVGSWPASA